MQDLEGDLASDAGVEGRPHLTRGAGAENLGKPKTVGQKQTGYETVQLSAVGGVGLPAPGGGLVGSVPHPAEDNVNRPYRLSDRCHNETTEGAGMGTKFTGTAEQRRTLDAYIKLRRAVNTVASRTSVAMRAAGLTESQFGVLEALHHLGPLCQKDIAVKVLKSAGNLTTVIDNLERRGLVRRERIREDRRVVMVHITGQGDDLVASIFPGHVEALVEAFAVLSAEEQEQLAELCRRLGIQEPEAPTSSPERAS